MYDKIIIKGASEHNLKHIDVEIPRSKFVVITGLSGSGKSSLVFDTLNREGQRQYLESLGQVTDFISKPKVESITGLSPAISIDQKNSNRNPRSTVGTITEVYTYLRILYARLGVRLCPKCGTKVFPEFSVGFSTDISEGSEETYQASRCSKCNYILPEIGMAHFSFNKPEGACPTCMGIGTVQKIKVDNLVDSSKSIPEGAVHAWDQFFIDRYVQSFKMAAGHYGFDFDISAPVCNYTDIQRDLLYYGTDSKEFSEHFPGIKPPATVPKGKFEGIITNYFRKYNERINDDNYRNKLEENIHKNVCPDCEGKRLNKESCQVTVLGLTILDIGCFSMNELYDWLISVSEKCSGSEQKIFEPLFLDLKERIRRICDVGLGYLSLSQPAPTLSAGEAQRLRLASLLGSGLTGVLYILDEPTVGLHPKDNMLLVNVLKRLRDLGNSVLVIEHDLDVIKEADYIIDMGPGAGFKGGKIIAQGTISDIINNISSVTGKYLKQPRIINSSERKPLENMFIEIKGAKANNLKNIDIKFPYNLFTVVTGASGSGKSTLLFDILSNAAEIHFNHGKVPVGIHDSIKGLDLYDRFIYVNQAAIGRTTRSNTATYTEIYSEIRKLFAENSQAKKNKLNATHFSFNVTGGRCEKCKGAGTVTVEMHFLPNVEVICPVCKGKRFQDIILDVKYRDLNIYEVLNLTVDEAVNIFEKEKQILNKLQFLHNVGLGYLQLGQSTSTLSGGESQRIKLARELGSLINGTTLYLLDEPTTGLHPEDTDKLIGILKNLVNKGHTVILIEHNLDVIKEADWIIDLGPEGGKKGGQLIFCGAPAELIKSSVSVTGRFLDKHIKGN